MLLIYFSQKNSSKKIPPPSPPHVYALLHSHAEGSEQGQDCVSELQPAEDEASSGDHGGGAGP